MNPKAFGNELREIRNDRKMTLVELQEKTGFTNGYLSMIENGHKGIPQPKTLRKIATALNADYQHLMYKAGHFDKETYNLLRQTSHKADKIKEKIKLQEDILSIKKAQAKYLEEQFHIAPIGVEKDEWHQKLLAMNESVGNARTKLLELVKSEIEILSGLVATNDEATKDYPAPEKDLSLLLNLNTDLYYEGNPINEDDKKKLLILIDTILK